MLPGCWRPMRRGGKPAQTWPGASPENVGKVLSEGRSKKSLPVLAAILERTPATTFLTDPRSSSDIVLLLWGHLA